MGITHIDMIAKALRKHDDTETHMTVHMSLGSLCVFR